MVHQFKAPKLRVDIYLEPQVYNLIGNYCRANGLINYSQGIISIIAEWRRFKVIVGKLESQIQLEDMKHAEIETQEKEIKPEKKPKT